MLEISMSFSSKLSSSELDPDSRDGISSPKSSSPSSESSPSSVCGEKLFVEVFNGCLVTLWWDQEDCYLSTPAAAIASSRIFSRSCARWPWPWASTLIKPLVSTSWQSESSHSRVCSLLTSSGLFQRRHLSEVMTGAQLMEKSFCPSGL